MKVKTALLICSLLCTPVMAKDSLTRHQPSGPAVEINGTLFFKADHTNNDDLVTGYSSGRSKRSLANIGVYSGDVLTDKAGLMQYTASGSVLVRADKRKAKQLAREYGMVVQSTVGGIAILKAKPGTELTSISSRMKEAGNHAQVELINQAMQPE